MLIYEWHANNANIVNMKQELIYSELSYKLNGIFYKAHNLLGRFRSEKSYADAIEEALKENGIEYKREFSLSPAFIGEDKRRNIPDFIIDGKIIADIKAKKFITKEDYIQMQRYLQSANMKLGMIINFRNTYLKPKRVINYNKN